MWVLPALVGACVALGIREWVEFFMRKAEKQRTCVHQFLAKDDTTWMGYRTQHCHRCGFQQDASKDKE